MRNQFTLEGNVGQKPELKKSKAGKSFLQFSVAVNDDYKAKDATEWTKRPAIWFNLVVFEKKAEELAKVLDKGVKVKVTGKLTMKKGPEDKFAVPELQVTFVEVVGSAGGGGQKKSSSASDMMGDDFMDTFNED